MRVAIIASRAETNADLAQAWIEAGIDAFVVPPLAAGGLGEGDVAIVRLDILPTLDGIEPGLELVPALRRAGVRVLNPPRALVGAHDKLETARRLRRAGVPHPRVVHVLDPNQAVALEPPVVVKPRFGSWGQDVARCNTRPELRRCLRGVAGHRWFVRHGALVEELVPGVREDLRLIAAGGRIVGAAGRSPAAGEWRTNVSLGGDLLVRVPDNQARLLGLAAVKAVGGDLVGVDLLPLPGGGHLVLELNGAVDFDERYSLPGTSVYEEIARALDLLPAVAGATILAA
ncbi:MAG: ATP-grasp domain-containing protein [Gaiellaceae bacterium]